MVSEAIRETDLLPGENRELPTPEDARHWVGVYDDLSRAVRGLLAGGSLEDHKRLKAMLLSFERRRAWWRTRF